VVKKFKCDDLVLQTMPIALDGEKGKLMATAAQAGRVSRRVKSNETTVTNQNTSGEHRLIDAETLSSSAVLQGGI
jgi:hypothetical protein